MQRMGTQAARLFKTLAGQDRDEPLRARAFALYTVLFMVALIVFSAWLTGVPID